MLGGSDPLTTFQMPKFEWVQPTLEFLSPTFTEFLLFFATLLLFIASWKDLRRALIMTFGDRTSRLRTLRIINEIEEHLGGYLLTVTMINVAVGIVTGIICALAGMPNPAGLGALAATLNYHARYRAGCDVRGAGGRRSCRLPDRSARRWSRRCCLSAFTFIEGHFVTPTIIGRRLALNALAVLLALAFWTWLWGPMGGFLSSPLLIVALILKEHLMPVEFAAVAGVTDPVSRAELPLAAKRSPAETIQTLAGEKNMTDTATYDRLQKDVKAVKSDIAALTDQITDALNSFAGTPASRRAAATSRRAPVRNPPIDDMSERGSAMMDAAQDAASSLEETLEDAITAAPARDRRHCARHRLPDRHRLAALRRADDEARRPKLLAAVAALVGGGVLSSTCSTERGGQMLQRFIDDLRDSTGTALRLTSLAAAAAVALLVTTRSCARPPSCSCCRNTARSRPASRARRSSSWSRCSRPAATWCASSRSGPAPSRRQRKPRGRRNRRRRPC